MIAFTAQAGPPMSDEDRLISDKAEARRAARRARIDAADPAAAEALIRRFPASLRLAQRVAGYWPLGSEIDPRPLMLDLAAAGAELLLPRMGSREGPARFHAWRLGDALEADAFGVMAPAGDAPEGAPELILVPLLAFDRRGFRLGQGGGHYDRILARLRPNGVTAVGLAYAAQEIEVVPIGALDQRLDWVVTEREAIRCG